MVNEAPNMEGATELSPQHRTCCRKCTWLPAPRCRPSASTTHSVPANDWAGAQEGPTISAQCRPFLWTIFKTQLPIDLDKVSGNCTIGFLPILPPSHSPDKAFALQILPPFLKALPACFCYLSPLSFTAITSNKALVLLPVLASAS